jgi:hypothetical protein
MYSLILMVHINLDIVDTNVYVRNTFLSIQCTYMPCDRMYTHTYARTMNMNLILMIVYGLICSYVVPSHIYNV